MKAVGYTRLSQESDTSINSQKEDIENYCREEDFELENIFNEGEKESGYDGDREKYQSMLEYLEFKEVDAVVVRDLSRLSRDRKERVRLLLDLDERGVELHSVERGEVDISEPWTLTIETIKATSDDVEKRKEIERSQKEIEKRKEKGYYHGRPPFGLQYNEEKTKLVPNEDFQDAIKVIELREEEKSYPIIEEETGVNKSTAYRIIEKKEVYLEKKSFLEQGYP